MTSQRSLEIRIGLVSLTAIILFIAGITLGRGCNVAVSPKIIKMRFVNSGGIQPSQPVVVNGVKRGQVNSVRNDQGSVLIEATVDDVTDLHSDATAEITILEITGGKKIDISPGNAPGPLDINKEIPGTAATDFAVLLDDAGKIATSATRLILRVDSLVAGVNNLLAEGKVGDRLKEIVANSSEAVSRLNEEIKLNSSKINSIVDNINELTATLRSSVDVNEPRVTALIARLDETLAGIRELSTKAGVTLGKADQLIGGLNDYSKKIQNSEGAVAKLLFDKQFAARLDSAMISLQQLTDQISKHGINTNVRLGTYP